MADPAPDKDVLVRDAEGRRGVVKASEVDQLIASGGQVETPEMLAAEEAKAGRRAERQKILETVTNPAQVYAGYQEAVTRGATLGLSDPLLTGILGDEYRKGALARSQNPATAIPEIAGAGGAMVASTLVGGAPGAAGGAARAATAGGRLLGAVGAAGESLGTLAPGVAGRGLGLAGRGAAEGALLGAGNEVSAASLEDRDLTVDKLLAAAGHSALAGGVLNVATGVGMKLLGSAGKAALEGMGGGKGLGESLADFAERRSFKDVTGNAVRYYNEATNFGRNPERINRIGRKLLDAGIDGSDPRAAANVTRERVEQIGQELRSIAESLDAQGVRIDPRTILSSADEQVAKLRTSDVPDFHDIANDIERKLAKVRSRAEAGESYTFTEAWTLRRDLDRVVKHAKENRTLGEQELSTLRNIIDDAVDGAADGIPARVKSNPELAAIYQGLTRGEIGESAWDIPFRGQFRDTKVLRSAFEGADANAIATGRTRPAGSRNPLPPIELAVSPQGVALRDGRHRMAVASDYGATEIGANIKVYDAAGDLLSESRRVIPMPGTRQQVPDLSAQWLKAKEDYSDFRIVRDALEKKNLREEKNRFTSPSDYFSGGMAFLSAVMSGGNALTALATAAASGMVHKQLREKGPGAIARIADRISKLDGRTNKAIEAAISGKPKDLPELPKRTVPLLAALANTGEAPVHTAASERERYERTLHLVRDLAGDPPSPEAAKRLGNATQQLSEDFPELASMLHQRVLAAARALNARAPVPLQRANPLQQHLEDRRVPAGLVARWLRQVDAVDTPESIWHDLAKGRVPREKIEILKETQPFLFADWRYRVMQSVAKRGEKLSRPQRIRLSLAFDFTGDPSIDPARIAQIQSEYAAQREQEAQQQQAPPSGAQLSDQTANEMKPATEQSFMKTG